MYFENEIESAKLLLPYIEEDIPILTSHYIGFGLRYLNYTKKINNKIFTIPVGKENEFTNNSNLQNVYTINNSIDNYTQSLRHKLIYDNKIIALIHNISDKNKQNNNGK
jgi:GTPase involved in cell partitioning and DNA repair